MNLRAFTAGVVALLAALPVLCAEPSLPTCMSGPPAPIVVRIGEGPARLALLRGGVSPPLAIVDAGTGQVLWTAAAMPPASQLFTALGVQFADSLLPLDLDGDGIHDRIYAGDLGGRLWRFDLHHGLPAERWATGGVFADFSSGSRGFFAAPDVSLPAAEPRTWFNIALGTVRLGTAAGENRLYVLRDRSPFESWTQPQYDRWRPLRESNLVQLARLGAPLSQPAPDGYFILVGNSDVLSPVLTVSGRATLALAQPGSAIGTSCAIAVVVSSIDLTTADELRTAAADGSPAPRLSVSVTAGESFALLREGSHASCMLGNRRIPACDVDLTPRRLWWRREDAD